MCQSEITLNSKIIHQRAAGAWATPASQRSCYVRLIVWETSESTQREECLRCFLCHFLSLLISFHDRARAKRRSRQAVLGLISCCIHFKCSFAFKARQQIDNIEVKRAFNSSGFWNRSYRLKRKLNMFWPQWVRSIRRFVLTGVCLELQHEQKFWDASICQHTGEHPATRGGFMLYILLLQSVVLRLSCTSLIPPLYFFIE